MDFCRKFPLETIGISSKLSSYLLLIHINICIIYVLNSLIYEFYVLYYYDPLCLYIYAQYIIAITTKRLPSYILYIPVLFATLYHSTGPKRPPFGPHTGHSVPCRLETSEGHPGYDLNSGTGNQPVQNSVR